MGLDDEEWGQRICALLVVKPDWKMKFNKEDRFNMSDFLRWLKLRLPKYCMPSVIRQVEHLPRNHMGKVNKKQLIHAYQGKSFN